MTPVEFYAARLDELETIARETKNPGRWLPEEEALYSWPADEHVGNWPTKSDARHAAQWHPAFILADIAAKRAVLKHLLLLADLEWTGSYAVREEARDAIEALCQPFADHPDYQKEWAQP